MARNGSGTMSIDYADFQSGANIVADELDANFSTIVTELTNSVAVDGQSTMTGDLAMGTNKITGVGDPTSAQDVVTKAYFEANASSGATTAEKSNIMLNSFRIEEQGGLTVQGMVDGVSDVFTDESGIDTATSTDEVYNATYDYYENAGGVSGTNAIPDMTDNTTPSGIASATNSNSDAWKAFDANVTSSYYWDATGGGVWGNGSSYVAYEFPSAKVIGGYSVKPRQVDSNDLPGAPTAWAFKGWDGSTWVTLDTVTGQSWSANTEVKSYTIDTPASYTKYGFFVTASGGYPGWGGNLKMFELTSPTNPVHVSQTFTALSQPDTAFITAWHEDVDAVTLNTDFTIEVSRDAGTTWTAVTLALASTLGAAKIVTGSVDISAQPAGTSMRWRAKFLNTISQRLRGVGLQWS
jgi:hypothetical protein